jgi:hypothetical protein
MSEALRLADESTNLAERRLESDGYEWSVDADVQLRETAAELRRLAQMEAELSQLRADSNNCGSGAGCCYQAAQNERLEAELQRTREELAAIRASLSEPVGSLLVGVEFGEELGDYDIEMNDASCEAINEREADNGCEAVYTLYAIKDPK